MVDFNTSKPVDPTYAQCSGGVPSATLKETIQEFAVKTDAFVQPLIGVPLLVGNITPVHHHHHSYGHWWYPGYRSSPQVVVVNGGEKSTSSSFSSSSSSSKRKKDPALAFAAAVAALVVVYTVGSSIASYQNAKQDLNEINDFQDMLEEAKENRDEKEQTLVYHAEKAAALKERICRRMKNSAGVDTALRVSLLGGLIATGVGAYVGHTALVTGSLVANLAAGSLILLKAGYDALSNGNMRDAQSLQAQLIHLR